MKQPEFWFRAPGILALLLAPLAAIWRVATLARLRRGPRARAAVPVICIGNLNVGGTGKTPLAIALAQRLIGAGEAPHVVSRGHGGTVRRPTAVDPVRHAAAEVGDEPLLLAAFAPTWVAPSRVEGARLAANAGASVIILDDGHQDPSLVHDFSIVVADADRGFGNGKVMPAGPLREPVAAGLRRADLLVAVAGKSARQFRRRWNVDAGLPIVGARMAALPAGKDWQGERVVAFAGIGNPGKFFASLEELGADIVKAIPLSDHQPLSGRLLARLERVARSHAAQLVTTEKDAVRLAGDWRKRILTLPVRLVMDDWSEIDARLEALGLAAPVGT